MRVVCCFLLFAAGWSLLLFVGGLLPLCVDVRWWCLLSVVCSGLVVNCALFVGVVCWPLRAVRC